MMKHQVIKTDSPLPPPLLLEADISCKVIALQIRMLGHQGCVYVMSKWTLNVSKVHSREDH